MPKTKTSDIMMAATAIMTWRVIQQLFNLRHIRGTPKSGDVVNQDFLTKDSKLKKSAVQTKIPQEVKEVVRKKMNEGPAGETDEEQAERIAQSLSNDQSFLNSLRVIFTPTFLRLPEEEPQPQPEEAGVEEEEPRPVPTKEVKPKKVVPPLVEKKEKRDVPPLVQKKPKPMESTSDSDVESVDPNKIKKFFNKIKNKLTSEESKKIVDDNIRNIDDLKFDSGEMAESYILQALRRIVSSEDFKINDDVLYEYNTLISNLLGRKGISQNDLSIKLYGSSLEDKKAKQKLEPQVEETKPAPTTEAPAREPMIVIPMIEELKRNLSLPIGLGGEFTGRGIGLTSQELEEARKNQGKQKGRKLTKPKTTVAKEVAKLEDVMSDVLERKQISTRQDVETGFGEMKQRLDDINVLLSSRPELKQIHADVIKQLEKANIDVKQRDTVMRGLGLEKKTIDELIKTIPAENRDILSPAVRSIAGTGEVNMNNVIAGLVGLGVSLAGSPAIGNAVTPLVRGMLNTYGVNLNDYFDIGDILPLPEKEKEKEKEEPLAALAEEDPRANEVVIDVLYDVADEYQPQATRESKLTYVIDTLLSLPQRAIAKISNLRRSRRELKAAEILSMAGSDVEEEIPAPAPEPRTTVGESFVRGVGTGSAYSALSAGVSTGTAQGAISGIIPGGIAGGVAGTITEQALENYYARQGIPMNAELRRKIKILSTLPASIVGAYIGFTPSGKVQDVAGSGVVSGAGITEKKITVDPTVLAQTKAQLDQEQVKNKVWQPKAITPTPDILDESKQEKYADDVEFIAFNYIPPTSEGAEGTVDTNPLKYQQLLESKIRYTDAGVYIPYITWNKINDANNISEKRLRTMALGPELPPMKFNTFDNETSFENVAKWQYVNGENTAIAFQSPYADFSNVENSDWTNETNMLFTINE